MEVPQGGGGGLGTGIGGRGVIQLPLGWRLLERRGKKVCTLGWIRPPPDRIERPLLLFRLGSIARERFATNHAGCGDRQEGSVDDGGGGRPPAVPWFSKSGAACNAHGKKRVGKCGLARKLPPSNLPNWRVGGSFRKLFLSI